MLRQEMGVKGCGCEGKGGFQETGLLYGWWGVEGLTTMTLQMRI